MRYDVRRGTGTVCFVGSLLDARANVRHCDSLEEAERWLDAPGFRASAALVTRPDGRRMEVAPDRGAIRAALGLAH